MGGCKIQDAENWIKRMRIAEFQRRMTTKIRHWMLDIFN